MSDTLAPVDVQSLETLEAPEPEAGVDASDLAESLVEEVSIDGMCGVY